MIMVNIIFKLVLEDTYIVLTDIILKKIQKEHIILNQNLEIIYITHLMTVILKSVIS
jgi:hypothetical protein